MLLFSFGIIFLFVLHVVANCSGMNSMKFGRMWVAVERTVQPTVKSHVGMKVNI